MPGMWAPSARPCWGPPHAPSAASWAMSSVYVLPLGRHPAAAIWRSTASALPASRVAP